MIRALRTVRRLFDVTRQRTPSARKQRLYPAPPAEGWFSRLEQPYPQLLTYGRLTLVRNKGRSAAAPASVAPAAPGSSLATAEVLEGFVAP